MKYLSLFLTILLIQVTCSHSSNTLDKKTQSKQINNINVNLHLSNNVIPKSYIIRIEMQFNNTDFSGKNKMKLYVKKATNQIEFHCGKNIKILSHSVTNNQKGVMLVIFSDYNEETEKYTIVVNDTMPATSITDLIIDFEGILSNDMKGVYTFSYWRYMNMFMNNETLVPLVGTHFQPTYARYAFPCFDEPRYKVNFTIIIRRPESFSSLCNLRLHESILMPDNFTSDVYKSDIPISTYQISFFVLKFTCTYNSQNTLRVCTQPQNSHHRSVALHVGEKARSFLSTFFNEPSQLPLVTMIGIPDKIPEITASFTLLTFNERRFLYDPIFTSDIDLEKIIITIIHGWASMWLGYVVTPEKWDYVWLNEGIATYLSYYVAYKTALSLTSEQQFIIDQVHPALLEDEMGFSKSLTRTITTLEETEQIQDTIISSKGSSIIRMIHLTLGIYIFEPALINYVNSRQNKISTPANFWSSFQNSINHSYLKLPVNFKTIMNSWTTQAGYPVLHVKRKENKVELRQHKFSINNQNLISNITWWIPITWASASNPDFDTTHLKYWFHRTKEEIIVNMDPNDWLIFNVQRAGFYRVNYDLKSWLRIIGEFNNHENINIIPPINRAMIIDDLFNLARAGIVSYDITLEGVSYIQDKPEMEYLPVKAALTGLQYLYERFTGQEYSTLFNNFFLNLILPIYTSLNNLKIPRNSSMIFLQAEIDEWVCKLGYKKCLKTMLGHFHESIKDPKYVIPKNKRSLVYCTAIKYGLLEDVLGRYFDTDNLIEKNIIRDAFKCTTNMNHLESLLKSAIRNELVFYTNKQEIISMFKTIAQSDHKKAKFTLEFISSHRKAVLDYFQDQLIIAAIVDAASKLLSSPEGIETLKNFIADNDFHFNMISDHLKAALNHAISEVDFYEKNYQTIVDWINEQEFIIWSPSLTPSEMINLKNCRLVLELKRNNHENLIQSLNLIQFVFKLNYYCSKLVLNFIKYLNYKFSGKYILDSFRIYILKIITPVYNKLGLEEKLNESIDDKLLRIEIVKCACLLEHEDCKQKSRQLYNNWKNNSSALLPVSLRRTILCTVIKWGDETDWLYLWLKYKLSNIPSERDVMRQALECTQSRKWINHFLIFATTKNTKIKESLKIFSSIYSSGLNGTEQTLDYMFENQLRICNYFTNDSIIQNIFKDLSNYLTTVKLLQKYNKCVNVYGTRYPNIRKFLQKYSLEAETELLKFNNLSVEVFHWLCSKDSDNNNPLPTSIVPNRYDIRLIPHLNPDVLNFDGFINITLDISSDTSYLVLNVGILTISSVKIYFINNLFAVSLNNIPIKLNYKYIIPLNMTVEAGTQLLICIKYKGYYNNIPNIFYRSHFTDQNGDKHWLAATQVDKYGARELFPCIDEPYFKAKFQLSIKRPNFYFSFTNMDLNSSEFSDNEVSVWDHYKITEPISPNNITIIITDLKSEKLENFRNDLNF